MTSRLDFESLSENEVTQLLLCSYSTGYDGIQIKIMVVKNAINLFANPLTHVIHSSLISGIFPDQLK